MAEFNLWLLILGIAAGAAVVWLAVGTIARSDDEVAAPERKAEAEWIARTIDEHGGRAPILLVEQILGLHRRYLGGGTVVPVPASAEGTPQADELEPNDADESPDAGEEARGAAEGAPPVSRRRTKPPSGRSRAAGRAAGP